MDPSAATPSEDRPATGRRGFLYGAAAVAAAAAGAGVAWWRFAPEETSAPLPADLWTRSFDTPQGSTLAMDTFRGKPLLINFWATWCPPCVEELPLIDAFYKQNSPKSWQVLGLAIDQPSAVKAFLARTPVSFPIGVAGMEGTELVSSLGNASGGLPFTVVVSAKGNLLYRKMGKVSTTDFANWAKNA